MPRVEIERRIGFKAAAFLHLCFAILTLYCLVAGYHRPPETAAALRGGCGWARPRTAPPEGACRRRGAVRHAREPLRASFQPGAQPVKLSHRLRLVRAASDATAMPDDQRGQHRQLQGQMSHRLLLGTLRASTVERAQPSSAWTPALSAIISVSQPTQPARSSGLLLLRAHLCQVR